MATKYHQGSFHPVHPEKYVGDPTKIFYRSSWELKTMKYFDRNPSILRWMSEELAIPYISPVDSMTHKYFPDFLIEVIQRGGKTKKFLVEVKPAAQCSPPKQKRKTKRMIQETITYLTNTAKWEAAKKWCEKNSCEFMILTEKELNV